MVLTFFFFSFFTVAMGMVAKTARDAYFLSRFDKSILPLMFLAVAVVIAPILTYYTKLSTKLAPRVLFMMTCAIFIVSFILFQPLITGSVIPVVYIWVEVVVGIMLIRFWTFAGDSFEPQQAKRLFSIIAGGGSFAVMIIGMNLKPFVAPLAQMSYYFLRAGFWDLQPFLVLHLCNILKKNPPKKGR